MTRFPTLVLVLLVLITSVRSQVITLTFEGTLNGAPVPLDSILVMNLTAGGDTMIYFPDNMLVLGSTGVSGAAAQAPVLRNQPNPFSDHTEILVGTDRSGQTVAQVHDATGRLEATYAGNLAAGQHRFRFTTATPGVHVLTVIQDGRRAAHRMVAMAGDASGSSLTYAGAVGSSVMAKSDRSLFTWTPGDELRYIGYATDAGIAQSGSIDEVPIASATRTFTLFAGRVCPESPTVADIDGHVYRAVQIGGQCWMAENLRTATYSDGSTIPNVTGNTAWTQLNSGAWSNYDNSPANDATYGKLYNWYAAANPNICPEGWHVPTDAEWQQLEAALGMSANELGLTGYRGADQYVGGKMKTTTLWNEPNTGANNQSGFLGRPGGSRRNDSGYFNYIGDFGFWWSASGAGADLAWSRGLNTDEARVSRFYNFKRNGFCLRCVRD
ncbi:MAG: fibrobacter succinogenes major paralogous domain-containing protein [Flavobacteriales bacterium]|nr:fibrobacter succinogenes major paralogous domain-containing protein [Flavobacteriales bacterium]